VVIVDVNVLLYAVSERSRPHAQARSWLDDALGGAETVGLAWVALLGFIRVITSPALERPAALERVLAQVEEWLAAPASMIAEPTPRHAAVLGGLLREVGTAGNLTTDAHLAALAIEHGADVVSYDRDFARFPGVRHRLPGG
jgi:toxin-antitoxin system PIN domain toxin